MRVIAETVFHDFSKGCVVVRLEVEVSGERLGISRSWKTGRVAYMTRERFREALERAVEHEQNTCRRLIMREIEKRIFE